MKIHDPKRKSLSLFQSDYSQLQSEVSSLTSWRYIVQAVPSKKKKRNFRNKRGKENEMEISGKEEKKKKGWKEFMQKEREKGE